MRFGRFENPAPPLYIGEVEIRLLAAAGGPSSKENWPMRRAVWLGAFALAGLSVVARGAPAPDEPQSPRGRFLELGARIAHAESNAPFRSDALTTLAISYAQAGRHDEAKAAIDAAFGDEKVPFVRGSRTEQVGKRLVEAAALPEARYALGFLGPGGARARLLGMIASVEAEKGRSEAAVETLLAACEEAAQMEDEAQMAQTLRALGEACGALQQAPAAQHLMEELIALAQQLPEADRQRCLESLASSANGLGLFEIAGEAARAVTGPDARAGILLALTRQSRKGGKAEEAVSFLQAAGEAGAACEEAVDRARHLAEVAYAYGEVGRKGPAEEALEQARRAAQQAAESRALDEVRMTMVKAWLKVDRVEEALLAAEGLRSTTKKAVARTEVGRYYVSTGQQDKAIELARSLPGRLAVVACLRSMAVEWARMGEYERARKLLEEIDVSSFRVRALDELAREAARRGDLSVGLEFAEAIENPGRRDTAIRFMLRAYAESAPPEQLLRNVEEFGKAARKIRKPIEQARALYEGANACLRAGQKEPGLRLARELVGMRGSGGFTDFSLGFDVAALLGRLGDKETARKIAAESLEEVRRPSCSSCQQRDLQAACGKLLALGLLDPAAECIRELGHGSEGLSWLVEIAEGYLERGQPEEARRVAGEILDWAVRADHAELRVRTLASLGALYEQAGFTWGKAERQAADSILKGSKPALRVPQAGKGRAKLLYFYTPTCADCQRVKPLLDKVKELSKDVSIRQLDLSDRDAIQLNKGLSIAMRLPLRSQVVAPAVFGAGGALVAEQITLEALKQLIASSRGRPVLWETDPLLVKVGGKAMKGAYENLTFLVVLGGGLVDGINPCAFAVIIFFVTYMAFVGKTKKQIALAGIYYTAAVFFTYLAIGLGLSKVFEWGHGWPIIGRRILYFAMMALLLVAAVLSFVDGVNCLRGRVENVRLKLPDAAKRKIHRVITKQSRHGLTIFGALSMGIVVALLEFPCTGQIYAPIVMYISQEPARAFGWLVLYNLCFIVPLLIIFLCVLFGVTNKQLTAFFQRHIAKTKFALTALFVGLIVVLVHTMLRHM